MAKNKTKLFIKHILLSIILVLLGASIIIFSSLTLDAFNIKVLKDNYNLIMGLVVFITSIFIILALCFFGLKQEFIYKLSVLIIVIFFIGIVIVYLLKIFGVLDKFSTIEEFRDYINSKANGAIYIFIILQTLQVVILPIPSFITIGAGVLIFGPLKSAIFSLIGILFGSFIAYLIGKKIGFKACRWLIGEKALNKGINLLKGKDKVVITIMFLFPFFPDDVLCFVCGILGMSFTFFSLMILFVRTLTIFISCFTLNNSIIPYNTWWGILIWITLFIACLVFCFLFISRFNKNKIKSDKNKQN